PSGLPRLAAAPRPAGVYAVLLSGHLELRREGAGMVGGVSRPQGWVCSPSYLGVCCTATDSTTTPYDRRVETS
ncbi:MAG: hypothetical protein ACRYF3_08225, partial [Janthinobacterium lividum]